MSIASCKPPVKARRLFGRLRTNEDGTTAIELGLIAFPFFMMLFGIMAVCMYFFSVFSCENAVWLSSRDLLTGIFQNASSTAYQTAQANLGTDPDAMKKAFKAQVCSRMQGFIDCTNDVRVLAQARSSFGTAIARPSCVDVSGNLIDETTAMSEFDAGTASTVVILTACVRWRFASQMPFLKFGNMPDNSRLIQASASFRTEPWQ